MSPAARTDVVLVLLLAAGLYLWLDADGGNRTEAILITAIFATTAIIRIGQRRKQAP